MSSLTDYGIQNEVSDLRAHVCVAVRKIYVFSTSAGVDCVSSGNFAQKPAYQQVNGTKTLTAMGCVVPVSRIHGLRIMDLPVEWATDKRISKGAGESSKGKAAVGIIKYFILSGSFPFPLSPHDIGDHDLQISGMDIIVRMTARIQVKCDWAGGLPSPPGTGNLYLQVAESNPLGKY